MHIIFIAIAAVVAALLAENDALATNMAKNQKVLVSCSDFPEKALNLLGEHFTVLQSNYISVDKGIVTENKEDLLKKLPGVSALIWAAHLPITKEILDTAGPQLKIVSAASAGYNHCNLPELKQRGIKLSNTPNVLSAAVAEVVVGLLLGAARRFTENLDKVRSGEWEIGFGKMLGQDVRGSTVGIVGFGGIGQAAVKRLSGFEVGRFLYSGHREKPEAKALNAEFTSLDNLLKESDFIVLAVPLTDETRHMINETNLGKMKKNAILVNVGRGDLIDQEALYNALKNNDIYAAGLDVTSPEPLPKDHKLLSLPNLFVLPHIGSATLRTRSDMAVLASNNVINALSGKPLITPILP